MPKRNRKRMVQKVAVEHSSVNAKARFPNSKIDKEPIKETRTNNYQNEKYVK